MKKYFSFIFIWWLATGNLFSQQVISDQNYINQTKYWFYRNRLINEFCKVGPNQGESLPMQTINYNDSRALEGDGSVQKLGHYIGVLATEYKLLKNSAQSTANTLRELYYALNAVKRLDQYAETYNFNYDLAVANADNLVIYDYPMYANGGIGNHNPSGADLESYWNGFLIRTDFDPRNGTNNLSQVVSPIYSWFNNMTGITSMTSDFGENIPDFDCTSGGGIGCGGSGDFQPKKTLNDVSQDQFNHLMMGFRLVQNLLDGTETFTPPLGTSVNLKQFAKDIITKIVDYMAAGSSMSDVNCAYLKNYSAIPDFNSMINWAGFLNGLATNTVCGSSGPFVTGTNTVPWLFQNPVLQQPSSINNSPGAAFPFMLTKGYATTGHLLTGNNYYVGGINGIIWKNFADNIFTEVYKIGDNYKILMQATLGNSWNYPCATIPCYSDPICFFRNPFNGHCVIEKRVPLPGIACGLIYGCDTGRKNLHEQSSKSHYEILPLLNNVLFGTSGFYYMDFDNFYATHINNAPCRGPYCNSSSDKASDDWASWNMFVTPDKGDNSIWNDASKPDDYGEYNGLDYMLLYNLHNIYNNNNSYYVNYDNNLDLQNRSIASGKQEFYNARGYKEGTAYYNGNLTASSVTVSSGGSLDFRAGASIVLNPGFSASAGSIFTARIYKPTMNYDWEMTVCGSFVPNTGIPNGHRQSASSENKVEEADEKISVNSLEISYPNPTSEISEIPYVITEEGFVEVIISDMYGKTIRTLVSEEKHPVGKFTVSYNVSSLNTGLYYYSLKTGKQIQTKKMMVVKE